MVVDTAEEESEICLSVLKEYDRNYCNGDIIKSYKEKNNVGRNTEPCGTLILI